MEKKETVNAMLSKSIKEKLKKIRMFSICYYEGCGTDDGWPE